MPETNLAMARKDNHPRPTSTHRRRWANGKRRDSKLVESQGLAELVTGRYADVI